ncbi:glycosyltransferase family 2 protein [Panacibacter ginsenosidivorans]|uniref:Glycosyltransferase family 2 protein n=1 Tax=Panacibacter ginsenosidivorans TaxID=1813871 RepID=A0A5B8V8D0_9BACT|nr:glycosyltransferase family 2 protein [Panacibacter ginsenosidivorans]QEC66628.1 glycosyltransferase family 2 protein [Panacibacter ginsenosidivorans]
MKKVSVITVNFNHNYVTEALLHSIAEKNTYTSLEIIVVDNGSKENPVPAWVLKYPHVQFIRSDKNLGFAGGNNLGIQKASGDYFFLVNNDTEFTEGLVEQLVATLEQHPECGIVSPKIRYFDEPEMLQYAGYTEMNYYTCRNKCIGQFEKDNGQYDNLSGVTGFAHGAAMMIKKEATEKGGLMAEHFFLYYEEMDWCEHIKRAGYTIRLNMQALIYHKESVSVGKASAMKEYFMNRNRILFIRRNAHSFKKIIFYCYFVLFVTPRNIIKYIKEKQYNFISILLKAITWNIMHDKASGEIGYPIAK